MVAKKEMRQNNTYYSEAIEQPPGIRYFFLFLCVVPFPF